MNYFQSLRTQIKYRYSEKKNRLRRPGSGGRGREEII